MGWSTGILGLGSVAVDDLIYASYAPPNVKTQVERRERHCGGQAATALVAAARLGAVCAYAGVLGTDELSTFAIERMHAEGVDLRYLQQRPEAFAVYSLVIVDEEKQTRNIYYQKSPHSGAVLDWPPEEVIKNCAVLLVDQHGIPGMTRAARIARDAGIPVVSDVEASYPGSADLFALVDHMVIPDSFALSLTGENSVERAAAALWAPGREAVVVTCGSQGSWYLGKGQGAPVHFPAFQVSVVDTTGCGDVFHGAYALALLEGMDLPERVRFASAAAAIKATQRGGQAGCPTRPVLDAYLA